MPSRSTVTQITGRNEIGLRQYETVRRAAIPGHPELKGLSAFGWKNDRAMNLVDAEQGILECVHTKQRLTVEDWQGVDAI